MNRLKNVIETETWTTIEVMHSDEDVITEIQGRTREAVAMACQRIVEKISDTPTHFVCAPIIDHGIKRKFEEFKV